MGLKTSIARAPRRAVPAGSLPEVCAAE